MKRHLSRAHHLNVKRKHGQMPLPKPLNPISQLQINLPWSIFPKINAKQDSLMEIQFEVERRSR